MSKFKIGQLVKMKSDRIYHYEWRNKEHANVTLPVAGIVLDIKTDNWIHPYYGMSKHFDNKEIKVEVAIIKWFDYAIEGLGKSDDFNLNEYNKNYTKVPTSRLSDFKNYLSSVEKKKELYK